MIHILGEIELPLSVLEWNCRADWANMKKNGVELEHYLAEMKRSVAKEGILKPPVVEWHLKETPSSGKKFRVKEGNHRCEVAHQLGWKKIKVDFYVVAYYNDWIVDGIKNLLHKEER